MLSTLVLKILLVPSLIGAVSLAGRKWGPGLAGTLAAFPVVAGPILFVLSLEHGAAFAARAAAATLTAVFAILVFGLSYAWAATRYDWRRATLCALAAYTLAVLALVGLKPGIWPSAIAILLLLPVVTRLYPRLALEIPAVRRAVNDIPLRMLAGGILVFVVTFFSSSFGPVLSGVLAMFPSIGLVLAVFSHRNLGAGYVVQLLRGMVGGYYAFATFCLALSLALQALDTGSAFALALAAAIGAHVLSQAVFRGRS